MGLSPVLISGVFQHSPKIKTFLSLFLVFTKSQKNFISSIHFGHISFFQKIQFVL